MQTQLTRRCVIEEETEELSEKPLCHPPSGNRSTKQSVRIHELARDPPSLIYPLYLSLPSSYSNKASRNCILSSSPNPATSSMFIYHPWFLPMLPNNTKTSLDTLKGCVSVWAINLSMVWKWRGRSWGNPQTYVYRYMCMIISNSQGVWLGFSLRSTP